MAARRFRAATRQRATGTIAACACAWSLTASNPLLAQAAGTVSAPAETTAPDGDPKVERARELAQNGGELYRDGSYDAAIDAFEAAYELVRDPNLLYNISLAHEKAGRFNEAADALDRYRAFAPAEEREQLQARSAELRAQEVGPAPEPTPPDREPPLDDGTKKDDPVDEPDGADPTDAPTEQPDQTGQPDRADEPLMGPVGWSLASVAVVGLGAGTGLGLLSVSRRDAAKGQCEPGVSEPLCLADADDDLQDSKRFALGADISFAIGGAAAVGTVVWALVRAKKRSADAARLELTPVLGRSESGVALRGRF